MRICELNLSQMRLRSQSHTVLQSHEISESLINLIETKFPNLINLDLRQCDLNNDEVSDLLSFAKEHSFIQSINLTNNCLNDEVLFFAQTYL